MEAIRVFTGTSFIPEHFQLRFLKPGNEVIWKEDEIMVDGNPNRTSLTFAGEVIATFVSRLSFAFAFDRSINGYQLTREDKTRLRAFKRFYF